MRKSQIALEFMIVFSFVLVVFAVYFAMVSTQKARLENNQIFSQEQLVAQAVANQLDRALQSGNGYSAQVPIESFIGALNYQIMVTKNGVVMVNATVGKQVLVAVAYSTAKNVVSNTIFQVSQSNSGSPYVLPTANGTLAVQNSFGTICVDYACPTPSATPSSLSLTAQTFKVGQFSNESIGLYTATKPVVLGPVTVSAWVDPMQFQNSQQWILIQSDGGGEVDLEAGGGRITLYLWCNGNWNGGAYSNNLISPSSWSLITGVWDGSKGYIYINGKLDNSMSFPCTETGTTATTYIGAWSDTYISNVQLYGTALSASKVLALYSEGIGGNPIAQASLVGWWPLEGNGNDYSGNGNNATSANPIPYPAFTQLYARVTNKAGVPVQNNLVGFATTRGIFTNGQSAAAYTNASGTAVTFLNQQLSGGEAQVEAAAYDANSTTQSNLVGWWPMNQSLNTATSTPDLSGYGNNGVLNGVPTPANTATPNINDNQFVANFNGQTSYISLPTTSSLEPKHITLAMWVYENSIWSNDYVDNGCTGWSSTCYNMILDHGYFDWNIFNGATRYEIVYYGISAGVWYFLTGTFDGSNMHFYVNGKEVSGSPASATLSYGTPSLAIGELEGTLTSTYSISDVQIYNATLSAPQIRQLYLEGIAGQPVPSAKIVGWWPLDGSANDYSGNKDNGTATSVAYVPQQGLPPFVNSSIGGYGISFNGMNYMSASVGNANLNLNAGGVNTASFWMFWGGAANEVPLSFGSGYSLMFNQQSGCFGFSTGNGDVYGIASNSLANKWVQVTAEFYNGNPASGSLYVNGIRQTLSCTVTKANQGSASNLIQVSGSGSGQYFIGTVADLRLYKTALSSQQALNIYQSGTPPSAGASIPMWWEP